MLGDWLEAMALLQIQMLPDTNRVVVDLDHIIRILAVFSTFAPPRCGRTALANNRSLSEIGQHIKGIADIRYVDMAA